ncbi:MAG: hypothetical protein ACUVXI_17580 [bacterium]
MNKMNKEKIDRGEIFLRRRYGGPLERWGEYSVVFRKDCLFVVQPGGGIKEIKYRPFKRW